MRVKTSELTEQGLIHVLSLPDLSWQTCGPIIEREGIGLMPSGTAYYERDGGTFYSYGHTALIAAMRCFCASRLGDEVEIPEELL